MKSNLIYCISIIIIAAACESVTNVKTDEPVVELQMPAALHSDIINDDFRIYTNLPENYDSSRGEGYDVIYVLDGDWCFYDETIDNQVYPGIVSISNRLVSEEKIPACISIGIGYVNENRRFRDYYFPPDTSIENYGCADKFYLFLKDELIPVVDSVLNTKKENGRILFGHSAAGYFVVYAFLNYDSSVGVLFNKFLASTPRVNYWDFYLLTLAEECYKRNGNDLKSSLFYCFGTGYNELSAETLNKFVPRFESYNFNARMVVFDGEDHGSVFYPSVVRGLLWLYEN